MALAELKELKTQLEELLKLKFIKPSSSPWAHQFFLSRRKTNPRGCALIIGSWIRLQYRTNILCRELMIYSTNFRGLKYFRKLIFGWDTISWESRMTIYQKQPLEPGMGITNFWWCHLDSKMPQQLLWTSLIGFLRSTWINFHRIHRWYIGLLQDRRRTWAAFMYGLAAIKRASDVCQV